MFDTLSRLFTRSDDTARTQPDPQLAVAALLVHLSAVDGNVTDGERRVIDHLLAARYGLAEHEVTALVELATRRDHEAVDYYQFTAALSRLEETERIGIIEMLWQLVFADQENHELEDNMVWRVAELIGVSARQRTILRNRVKKQSGAG